MDIPKRIQDLSSATSLGNSDVIVLVPNGTGDAKKALLSSLVTFLKTTFSESSEIYTISEADAKFALKTEATKDFTELTNRPEIDSIVLASGQSARDLGLLKDTFKINTVTVSYGEDGIPVISLSASDISAADATHAGEHATSGSDPIAPSDIGAVAISNGELKDTVCTFTIAASRELITTGSTLGIILGKVLKYFTDLKGSAYKDVGTTANDVASGIHASTHASGGTDPMKVGTNSGLPIFTGTGGVLVTKSVADALVALNGISSISANASTASYDLNSLTTAFSYISTSTLNSSDLFTLISGTNAIVFQYTDSAEGKRQVAYSATSNKIATRSYASSTWSSWSSIYTSATTIPNTITKGGSGSFCSSSGTGTVITHNFGSIATSTYFVSVTPSQAGNGNIGEIYVTKNADGTFTVYNTGSATTTFDWIVTKP